MSRIVSSPRAMAPAEWGLLLTLSVLWGGSFFFVAVAVQEIPPLTLVLLRVGMAALVLNAVLPLIGVALPRGRKAWCALAVMSVLNNVVPFCLFVWAQTRLTGGAAAILNATTPLFGVLIAHLVRNERMTWRRLAGTVLGFCGVVVMVGAAALRDGGQELAAAVACLVAALSYACAGVWGRRFAPLGITPIQTATGQLMVSTLILMPVAIGIERPWTMSPPSASAWTAMIGLATLSTALGYVLFFRLIATVGATNSLLVTFLVPVSAILLGALVLGEALEARHVVGMLLIGAGLAAIDGRLIGMMSRRLSRSLP